MGLHFFKNIHQEVEMIKDCQISFGPNLFRFADTNNSVALHEKSVNGRRPFVVDYVTTKKADLEGYAALIQSAFESCLLLGKKNYISGVLITPKIALRLYALGVFLTGEFTIHSQSFDQRMIYVFSTCTFGSGYKIYIQDSSNIMWPVNNSQWSIVNHSLLPE